MTLNLTGPYAAIAMVHHDSGLHNLIRHLMERLMQQSQRKIAVG